MAWTSEKLDTIGSADEVTIETTRQDGSLRKPVIVWIVRHGDDLYIRSVNGRGSDWFRGALTRHEGRLRVGSVEKEITFVEVDGPHDEIDAAYWEKYRRYPGIVPSVVKPEAQAATLRLDPR
jgi:hypothetical protein